MTPAPRFLIALGLLTASLPAVALAHFRLLEPTSSIVENERGDPQKAGPCGGDNSGPGTPSHLVTQATGGQLLHIKLLETVHHPGHYRVSLAVKSRAELPADPETTTRDTEKGPWSVSAVIQNPPTMPVLADGLFAHEARPESPDTFETDVRLPNINCELCTLQIVEFMANHGYNNPGGYSYHHCADVKITVDAGKPVASGWPGQ